MTCKQLGGACDKKFQANTLQEIAELGKVHGMEMFAKKDPEHLEAMTQIQLMLQRPHALQAWFDAKTKEFDALPDD